MNDLSACTQTLLTYSYIESKYKVLDSNACILFDASIGPYESIKYLDQSIIWTMIYIYIYEPCLSLSI